MRMKNKKWSKPFIDEHQECVMSADNYDLKLLHEFIDTKNLNLEIGSGKGDFILNMAKMYPNANFIGIEKSVTCLAITAKKIVNDQLNNVLLIADDVSKVFEHLPDHSIDTIYLNFSDPWPKKRHAKRRLTFKTFLDSYSRILKSNGKIIMKTDNLDLFDFSIESFKENNYDLEVIDYDYAFNDEVDAMTEYESYFRNLNTPIKRLIAKVGKKDEIK